MNFVECCKICITNPELVKEFNRLTKCKLGVDSRSPIEKMIDDVTKFDESKEDLKKFVNFIDECIWMPLVRCKKI